jgi:hypothetical protein
MRIRGCNIPGGPKGEDSLRSPSPVSSPPRRGQALHASWFFPTIARESGVGSFRTKTFQS